MTLPAIGKFIVAIASAVLLSALAIQAQAIQAQQLPPGTYFAPGVTPGQSLASLRAGTPGEAGTPVTPQVDTASDRLVGAVPSVVPEYTTDDNYATDDHYATDDSAEQFVPLSEGMKFKLSADRVSSPATMSFAGMSALIGQAENTYPSYGQGFQGYEKRYATAFADSGIRTAMTASVFPALLHQDPRYFRLGSGSAWHRAMYAASRVFITRSDDGGTRFNYSAVVGNAAAAGLANAYHPSYQRTLGNTLGLWNRDILLGAAGNVVKEFWPDVRRRLHKQEPAD